MTPLLYVILSLLALLFISLVVHVHALERAAARRRASLEPVVLLPKCVAVPAAWRKRIGWWM